MQRGSRTARAVKRVGRLVEREQLARPPIPHSSPPIPATNTSSSKAAPKPAEKDGERRAKKETDSLAATNSYSALSVESEEDDLPDKDDESGAELLVSASSVSSRSSTIVARGELDGVACADMLIDMGASVSFVRRHWAVNSGLCITELKHPITVTLADQRTTVCTQRVRLSCMSVHGSKAAATLLVMDELSNEVIVGLSWQRAARLAITPGHPHDLLNGRPVSRSKAASTPRRPAKEASTPAVEPSAEPTPRVRLAAALVHSMRTHRVVSRDEQRDQHEQ